MPIEVAAAAPTCSSHISTLHLHLAISSSILGQGQAHFHYWLRLNQLCATWKESEYIVEYKVTSPLRRKGKKKKGGAKGQQEARQPRSCVRRHVGRAQTSY